MNERLLEDWKYEAVINMPSFLVYSWVFCSQQVLLD